MKTYYYLLFYLVLINGALASECNLSFKNSHNKDEITSSAAKLKGYEGIGVSSKTKKYKNIALLIQSARVKAIDNLIQSISVSVNSETLLSEQLTDSHLQSTFISNTELKATGTFEEIETIGYWFDEKSCDLWLKVRISSEKANLAILNTKLAALTYGFKSSSTLSNQLNELAHLIDETQLFASDKALFEKRYLNIKANITEQIKAQTIYIHNNKKLAEIKSKSRGKRIRAYRAIAESNRGLLPLFIDNSYGISLLEPLLKDISYLYTQEHEYCKGQNFLGNFTQYQQQDWYIKDEDNFTEHCAQTELTFESELAGAIVLLQCELVLDAQPQHWDKICSEFADYFFSKDAIPVFKTPTENKASDFSIKISANGLIETNSSTLKNRFNGKISVQLEDDYSIIISDSYTGLTGWSQYPNDIIIDMLAINIFKRFNKKISKQ